jgi:hypothetical protein
MIYGDPVFPGGVGASSADFWGAIDLGRQNDGWAARSLRPTVALSAFDMSVLESEASKPPIANRRLNLLFADFKKITR